MLWSLIVYGPDEGLGMHTRTICTSQLSLLSTVLKVVAIAAEIQHCKKLCRKVVAVPLSCPMSKFSLLSSSVFIQHIKDET